ncbi:hypothetical protein TraAM80_10531 [Trypanosoma rangeli]|uniref:Uncharacterized protein n=1 Tax=Trypanosoma rangeli TaxID=5698 RepID=A0A422MNU1_TRYRA|nr:uncharacterized protein TraAM80_10531 [Trypanosoma rangeli]RNE94871.1 hypothetical protein TraAM80_10531 [Trypanosoma rangeli]|eukprot:RNE94871.1 hypothetical protein TraAM80_10531 [Trypanosoma rangeli]
MSTTLLAIPNLSVAICNAATGFTKPSLHVGFFSSHEPKHCRRLGHGLCRLSPGWLQSYAASSYHTRAMQRLALWKAARCEFSAPLDMLTAELHDLFSRCGLLDGAIIIHDIQTNLPK